MLISNASFEVERNIMYQLLNQTMIYLKRLIHISGQARAQVSARSISSHHELLRMSSKFSVEALTIVTISIFFWKWCYHNQFLNSFGRDYIADQMAESHTKSFVDNAEDRFLMKLINTSEFTLTSPINSRTWLNHMQKDEWVLRTTRSCEESVSPRMKIPSIKWNNVKSAWRRSLSLMRNFSVFWPGKNALNVEWVVNATGFSARDGWVKKTEKFRRCHGNVLAWYQMIHRPDTPPSLVVFHSYLLNNLINPCILCLIHTPNSCHW